jgi:hypothetical protein
MLITLPQDLHPDWHHSDSQEWSSQTTISWRRCVARGRSIIRHFSPSRTR